ncbi:hypothetical protein D3C72_1121970 [compost metagenome]
MAFMRAYFNLKAGIVAVDVRWLGAKADRHAARLFVQALVAHDDPLSGYLRLGECAAQRPALTANLEHIPEVAGETQIDRQQTGLITVIEQADALEHAFLPKETLASDMDNALWRGFFA